MLGGAGDCTDGAGVRPRCDVLWKDSGKDVHLMALLGSLQRGNLASCLQSVDFVWSTCD